MSTQVDAFAHRRLASSSKTLAALLVYPSSSVGFVIKQLRNCLFDFRGVRNVRSRIVCVRTTEAESKNARKERDVKLLLLSEEFLPLTSLSNVESLCQMHEETNCDNTLESVQFVSVQELLELQHEKTKEEKKGNVLFPSTLHNRLCHGFTYGNGEESSNVDVNHHHNNNLHKNKMYMNTEFALATFTLHLTYANYTMPELLKMVVVEHYESHHFDCERSSTKNINCKSNVDISSDEEKKSNTSKSEIAILSGFEQVGHIAHVNLAESHLPFALCIGQVILDCNPNIHVVVNKVESIATTFREFKMDVIALRLCAIQCLLHEYVHTHAKYGPKMEFIDVQPRVEAIKKFMAESFCASNHTTVERNHATLKKWKVLNKETSVNSSSSNNNNDETFNVQEFIKSCLSDHLIDALLTSTVKQEGCFFTVPYNKVYWNSRLGHEHSLLVSQMSSHDVLFDVMAGVGPFAVPAALRGLDVFANDLNPYAAAYMQLNRVANHLHSSAMHIYNMDGREFMRNVLLTEFVKDLKSYFTTMMQEHLQQEDNTPSRRLHVVMNLPALAVTFLDVFAPQGEEWGGDELRKILLLQQEILHTGSDNTANKSKQDARVSNENASVKILERVDDTQEQLLQWLQHKCVIHVYCFSSAENVCADALAQVEQHIGYSLHSETPGEMCEARLVRDVSPLKRMICVSFSLPRLFWQRHLT